MSRFLTSWIMTGILLFATSATETERAASHSISILWVDELKGDFSFKDKWSYPEGIYVNDIGQLSCDGLCPPAVERMIDKKGHIYKDSLEAFYRLVDTTHQFHSIQADAWCYEWAGTDLVTAIRAGVDTVTCFSHTSASTHCSLHLIITKGKCIPYIRLSSMSDTGTRVYVCKSGQIAIDRNLWSNGILKAEFDLIFDHKEDPGRPMYWKGAIYKEIEQG